MNDYFFMKRAIELSKLAVKHGNEPFGAVLVKDGEIVFENENQIYTRNDPTFHAEMGLLNRFCKETGITDLSEYILYSSCEPCFMCSGAMVWLNLGKLVYAAGNSDLEHILGNEAGSSSGLVFENSFRKPEVVANVMREESIKILAEYFSKNGKG